MIDVDKLEKLAKAATPGPWMFHETPTSFSVRDNRCRIARSAILPTSSRHDDGRYNASFIAACDPQTILALLKSHKALERLTRWVDEQDDNREGTLIGAEATCPICTSGATPIDLDKGPCPFHGALAALSPFTTTGQD